MFLGSSVLMMDPAMEIPTEPPAEEKKGNQEKKAS
jgi:hypothetical protein